MLYIHHDNEDGYEEANQIMEAILRAMMNTPVNQASISEETFRNRTFTVTIKFITLCHDVP